MTAALSAFTLAPEASTPLPSSSTWNLAGGGGQVGALLCYPLPTLSLVAYLRFSRSMTVPWAGEAQAASTSGPTQSARKVTSCRPAVPCTV